MILCEIFCLFSSGFWELRGILHKEKMWETQSAGFYLLFENVKR